MANRALEPIQHQCSPSFQFNKLSDLETTHDSHDQLLAEATGRTSGTVGAVHLDTMFRSLEVTKYYISRALLAGNNHVALA